MAGVQQPGMTGQVKEDLLSRLMELGVKISNGCIVIDPVLLTNDEFLTDVAFARATPYALKYPHVEFGSNVLAFSFCNVPFVYTIGGTNGVKVTLTSGEVVVSGLMELSEKLSQDIFARNGNVEKVEVTIPRVA